MKTIETSSAQEIAEYLQYLYNIARDKALENHPTYSKMYDDNAWEKLYHKVFSEEISRVIYKRFPNFDWFDPYTSYYEDVNTFIEAASLEGMTVIPFATSGSSNIANSVDVLKKSYPKVKWQTGKLLNRASGKEIDAWVSDMIK